MYELVEKVVKLSGDLKEAELVINSLNQQLQEAKKLLQDREKDTTRMSESL